MPGRSCAWRTRCSSRWGPRRSPNGRASELLATGERARVAHGARRPGPHAAGGAGRPPRGRRHDQRRDRLTAVHQREDRRLPPRQDLPEARHRLPPAVARRDVLSIRECPSRICPRPDDSRSARFGEDRCARSRTGRRGRVPRVPGWRRRRGRARRRRARSPDGCWSRAIQPTASAVTGQQREQHGEAPDRDAAHHELVDAVADGVGEHADEQAQARAACGDAQTGPLHGAPTGRHHERSDRQADAQPGDAAIELRHPSSRPRCTPPTSSRPGG